MAEVKVEFKENTELNESVNELQPEEIEETLEEIEEQEEEEKKEKKKSNFLLYLFIGLLVLSLVANVIFFLRNRNLKKSAVTAENKMIKYQNENAMLQEKILSLDGENQELDRSLETAFQNMADKDILIASLNKENETLREIKEEVNSIGLITQNLNNQVTDLKTAKDKLKAVQSRVNKTIDNKHAQNKKIAAGLK